MKNIKAFLVSSLAFTTIFSSCTKHILDTEPQTSISEQVAFSTPEKILAQVNNLYSRIQHFIPIHFLHTVHLHK